MKTWRTFLRLYAGGLLSLSLGAMGCGPNASSSANSAGDSPATSQVSQANAPKPKAVVEDSVYDFGVMEVGETKSHTFTIRNEGQAPLVMEKGDPGCICISSFDVEKLTFAPGESTQAKVVWHIEKPQEGYEKYAPLSTNDPENKQIKLTIKGNITEVLAILPATTWLVGELNEKSSTEFKGQIVSSLLDVFEIKSIDSSNSALLTAKVAPLDRPELEKLNAKSGYQVETVFGDKIPVGDFHEKLVVHTSVRDGLDLTIEVVGKRSGPLRIIGKMWDEQHMLLRLGTFSSTEGRKATLTLFAESPDELKFLEVAPEPEWIKVSLEHDKKFLGKSKRYVLTFEIPPGSPPNADKPASVIVKTNNPEIGTIRFRVSYQSSSALQ